MISVLKIWSVCSKYDQVQKQLPGLYKKFSLHLISLLVTLTLTQIHPPQLCPVLHHHFRHLDPHLKNYLYDQQHQPLRNDKCQRESYLSKLFTVRANWTTPIPIIDCWLIQFLQNTNLHGKEKWNNDKDNDDKITVNLLKQIFLSASTPLNILLVWVTFAHLISLE